MGGCMWRWVLARVLAVRVAGGGGPRCEGCAWGVVTCGRFRLGLLRVWARVCCEEGCEEKEYAVGVRLWHACV